MRTITTAHVKALNTESVRSALLEGEDTKIGLSRRTGLSFATCATIIRELVEGGEVLPGEEVSATGGRPAQLYRYNPHHAHILGLYVSNEGEINEIACATSTSTGETITRETFAPGVIDYEAIEKVIAEALERDGRIKAIGIGVPGIVSRGVVGSCDIEPLRGLPLAERLQGRFGLATVLENDMNLAAYGYYQRHAQEIDSLVMVILPRGNGPGTGIIVDGKIVRGHSGFAGEVHMLPEGYNALFQSAEEEALMGPLSRMLATIIVMVNPERILLTGRLLRGGMIEPLDRMCRELIPTEHCPELIYQEDCSAEYLEGLSLKAHEALRYHHQITLNG